MYNINVIHKCGVNSTFWYCIRWVIIDLDVLVHPIYYNLFIKKLTSPISTLTSSSLFSASLINACASNLLRSLLRNKSVLLSVPKCTFFFSFPLDADCASLSSARAKSALPNPFPILSWRELILLSLLLPSLIHESPTLNRSLEFLRMALFFDALNCKSARLARRYKNNYYFSFLIFYKESWSYLNRVISNQDNCVDLNLKIGWCAIAFW